jgi:hypothetical protein
MRISRGQLGIRPVSSVAAAASFKSHHPPPFEHRQIPSTLGDREPATCPDVNCGMRSVPGMSSRSDHPQVRRYPVVCGPTLTDPPNVLSRHGLLISIVFTVALTVEGCSCSDSRCSGAAGGSANCVAPIFDAGSNLDAVANDIAPDLQNTFDTNVSDGSAADAGCEENCRRVVTSADPKLKNARVEIPHGASSPDQAFTIAVDEGFPPGSRTEGRRSVGYAVSFEAVDDADYHFTRSTECTRLTIPYDATLVNRLPFIVRNTLAVNQLTSGHLIPVSADVDKSHHVASFCTTHLSTYVVTAAGDCTPVHITGTIADGHPTGATSTSLETAIPFPVPSGLALSSSGLIDLILGSPQSSQSVTCHYRGESTNGMIPLVGCSDDSVVGTVLIAREFTLGVESADGSTFGLDISNVAHTCAERDLACGVVSDNCGGTLNCADEGDPCTSDTCTSDDVPVHEPQPVGSSCSDGDACNGSETCDANGLCLSETPKALEDGNICTIDTCDQSSGSIGHEISPWTGCDSAPGMLADLCPGGVASANEFQFKLCGENLGYAAQDALDSELLDAAWRQFVVCISASIECATATFPSEGASRTAPISRDPLARSAEVCDDEGYNNCRRDVLENYLVASTACAAVGLLGVKAANPLVMAAFGICMTVAYVNLTNGLNRCDRDFGKSSSQVCCGTQKIDPCSNGLIPKAPSCCSCLGIVCDGICVYASKCI